MKAKWNFFFIILFFSIPAFTGFAQGVLSQVGLTPEEGMLWTEKCEAPAIHQLSDTLTLYGNFDGIPENTSLIIDGQVLTPVWETRQKALFYLQKVTPGKQAYTLKDTRLHYEDDLQLVRVSAHFSETVIRKGKEQELRLTVEGLKSWDQQIVFKIENNSRGFYTLAEGNQQQWSLSPEADPVKIIRVKSLEKHPGSLELEIDMLDSNMMSSGGKEVVSKR